MIARTRKGHEWVIVGANRQLADGFWQMLLPTGFPPRPVFGVGEPSFVMFDPNA